MMSCRCSRVLSAFTGLLAVICWPAPVSADGADWVREGGAGSASQREAPRSRAKTPRASTDLSQGWRFRQEAGLGGVERSEFDDSQWTGVDLPHTWNRIGNEGTERSPLTNTVQ
jgi:hypothetical protein